MKLADYVIEYLKNKGVRKVFTVYGAAIGDLIDAFSRIKGIDYVAVMHEQAGAFAAETYAKVSDNIGCCIVTSGPGGTNLLTGIANCYYDSVPCIFITGQINSKFLKKSPILRQVGFQENDIVAMAKPITKMAVMVDDPGDIKGILDLAFMVSRQGRPGPVLIDIPMDIQKVDVDPEELYDLDLPPELFTGADEDKYKEQIRGFVKDFQQAKRPILLVGGGVRIAGAVYEAKQLGMMLKIPCLVTWNAIDIFTSDYEYYRGRVGTYGGAGRNFAIQNSDLLLSIGSRISGRITGGYIKSFARGAKKYIVDVDHALLNKELQDVRGDVNICCDAKQFIFDLISEVKDVDLPDRTGWLDKTKEWRDKYVPCLPEYYEEKDFVHPYVFMKVLSEELEPCDVVIADCGGNAVVTSQVFEAKSGQRVCSSHGNSPMGYSFAGAMGACFIDGLKPIMKGYTPINRVICIIGDGGFNMNIQELQTVKYYGLKLKTFILNNHSYGITRQFQDTNYEGRYLASGPDGYNPPDFIKIAQAYGIETEKIEIHDGMRGKIKYVLNHDEAVVCDVDCGMFSKYEPRIFGWRTPIEDMYPYLDREEFKSNMIIEPVEGWENPAIPGKAEGSGLA